MDLYSFNKITFPYLIVNFEPSINHFLDLRLRRNFRAWRAKKKSLKALILLVQGVFFGILIINLNLFFCVSFKNR